MQQRGIRIPLSRRSWERIVRVLCYVIEKPHIDDLEEEREDIGDLLRYIEGKLKAF